MTHAPQRIFDPHQIRLHQARARSIGGIPFLLDEAAEGIRARLEPVCNPFDTGISIGPQSDACRPYAGHWQPVVFDEDEQLENTSPADLAISLLNLHRINDLPGALSQIRGRLLPGGLFLAALFGGETLHELREALEAGDMAATGMAKQRVAPFADVQALGNLMKRAGFTEAVADSERTTVHYSDLSTLFADLRSMGESGNLTEKAPLSRAALTGALSHYAGHARNNKGKYIVTFDIIYLTGWIKKLPEKITIPR